jgi:hypothetical protein
MDYAGGNAAETGSERSDRVLFPTAFCENKRADGSAKLRVSLAGVAQW